MILNKLCRDLHNRRIFNAKDKKDLEEYGYFINNMKWKTSCPFWLEWPYASVPAMIKDKIVRSIFESK
jgi:hypothetical protein